MSCFIITALPALPAGGEGWRGSLRGVGRQRAPSTIGGPEMNRRPEPRVTDAGTVLPGTGMICRVDGKTK
ncbi:hypothetical protein E9451_12450 [Salmonella enterica]|nr:hypothetical protein [Salmonella enterica]